MNRDFLPTASMETLRQRAEILNQIRDFFEARLFFHVETPVLSHDVVVDRHLHPISIPACQVHAGASHSHELFLQTSPEFGMKRLLAAGAKAIYQIGKVFRAAECGAQHNPEFTMLEWYRVGDNLPAGMSLLSEFAAEILDRQPAELKSYASVFEECLGIDPHRAEVRELADVAVAHGIDTANFDLAHTERDEWLNLILSHLIEPQLGVPTPTIVYDWPATQSALAIVRESDPPVAERFELYVDGVELANGYHELLDADELLSRNRKINAQRRRDGAGNLPNGSRLLEAMKAGLPDCAGVAVGIDRLIMVALGKSSIDEVIAFPISRA